MRNVPIKANGIYIEVRIESLLVDRETLSDLDISYSVKYHEDSIAQFKEFIRSSLTSFNTLSYLGNSGVCKFDIYIGVITREADDDKNLKIVGKHESEILDGDLIGEGMSSLGLLRERVLECIDDAVRDINYTPSQSPK